MSFTKTQLANINLKAEEMWTGSQATTTVVNSEAAKAVIENQTATFPEFDDRKKDKKITVSWLSSCDNEVRDCVDSCEINEQPLSSDTKDYEPKCLGEIGFSVNETELRTNRYSIEEVIAKGQNSKIIALDEKIAQIVLVGLKGASGVNVAPSPFTYDAVNKNTVIPAADYNVGIVGNLIQQAQLNQIQNPYYINDGSLWLEWFNKQMNAGNMDGMGDAQRVKALRMYFDQINFAKAGLTDNLFTIDPNAVALKTVNKHEDGIRELGGKVNRTLYTVDSLTLPGVKYDVVYTLECITGEQYVHQFRYRAHGLFAVNPESCPVTVGETTASRTGVLAYKKGA